MKLLYVSVLGLGIEDPMASEYQSLIKSKDR